jgi:hypothetical protein
MINTVNATSYAPNTAANSLPTAFAPLEHWGHDAVSVMPHFSPSHAILSTTTLPTAIGVVGIEASVFGPAQKPRHSREIRESQ